MKKLAKTEVRTDAAPAPVGPYSQAILAGPLLFCSGQISIDPATNQVVKGPIEDQTRQVLENLKAVLAAGGADLGAVVRTTIFLRRMDDFPKVNEVYGRYFEKPAPARATVEVSRLPKDVDVEIDAIAYLSK